MGSGSVKEAKQANEQLVQLFQEQANLLLTKLNEMQSSLQERMEHTLRTVEQQFARLETEKRKSYHTDDESLVDSTTRMNINAKMNDSIDGEGLLLGE